MQQNDIKTCRNCYYFNNQPRFVSGEDMPAGCRLLHELVTSLDPETNQVITSRPVIASDPACDKHVIEQEFLLQRARKNAKVRLQPSAPAAERKLVLIRGGDATLKS